MSNNNADAAKTALDLARVRNETFVDTIKAQRNAAQDSAAALAAEVSVLRTMLDNSKERERALVAETERLKAAVSLMKSELDKARSQLPTAVRKARKSRAQQTQ